MIVSNIILHVIKLQKMKSCIKLPSLMFCICLISTQIIAQCPTSLTLCSQDSVDAFPSTYPGCRDLFALRINALHCDGKPNDIVNLDSLYPLQSVQYLTLQSPSMIKDISGLSNIRKVYQANINVQKSWQTPFNLDTVGLLSVNYANDTVYDLKLLYGIKFVTNVIHLNGNVSFSPKLRYNTDRNIRISINDNEITNKISNVLPKNIVEDLSIQLTSTQNIDFDFGFKIDSLSFLALINSPTNDYSYLKEIKKIKHFAISHFNVVEKLKGFKCEEIEILHFYKCDARIKISEIFPNLKKISKIVSFQNNTNLESIVELDNLELPTKFLIPDEILAHVKILNNLKLNTCKSDYLCRAFKRFRDSIYVGGNMMDCNELLLEKECSLSSVGEADIHEPYTVSPNPVFDILTISPPMPNGTRYRVINLLGNTVKSGEMFANVHLGDLSAGNYFILLDKPDVYQPPQVIKIVKL